MAAIKQLTQLEKLLKKNSVANQIAVFRPFSIEVSRLMGIQGFWEIWSNRSISRFPEKGPCPLNETLHTAI